MPKKSYAEHLFELNPMLRELSSYYESLGLVEAALWAKGEVDGEPSVATAALVHAFTCEVPSLSDCQGWLSRLRSGDINVEEDELLSEAQDALVRLDDIGVPMILLSALVRAARAETANDIAQLIDHGARICCVPLPAGRESDWQLFETDANGDPKQPISGFATIVRTSMTHRDT